MRAQTLRALLLVLFFFFFLLDATWTGHLKLLWLLRSNLDSPYTKVKTTASQRSRMFCRFFVPFFSLKTCSLDALSEKQNKKFINSCKQFASCSSFLLPGYSSFFSVDFAVSRQKWIDNCRKPFNVFECNNQTIGLLLLVSRLHTYDLTATNRQQRFLPLYLFRLSHILLRSYCRCTLHLLTQRATHS